MNKLSIICAFMVCLTGKEDGMLLAASEYPITGVFPGTVADDETVSSCAQTLDENYGSELSTADDAAVLIGHRVITTTVSKSSPQLLDVVCLTR